MVFILRINLYFYYWNIIVGFNALINPIIMSFVRREKLDPHASASGVLALQDIHSPPRHRTRQVEERWRNQLECGVSRYGLGGRGEGMAHRCSHYKAQVLHELSLCFFLSVSFTF